jgi:hypothetical protein
MRYFYVPIFFSLPLKICFRDKILEVLLEMLDLVTIVTSGRIKLSVFYVNNVTSSWPYKFLNLTLNSIVGSGYGLEMEGKFVGD